MRYRSRDMTSVFTAGMFGDRSGAEGRPLDPVELRVLGSLLEKQQTTPELYPLTTNALRAACNQKTNREPVMHLGEREIAGALESLTIEKLVREVAGARARRWEHLCDYRWSVDRRSKALLTVLILRGPQTAAELRERAGRLAEAGSIADLEEALEELSQRTIPFVVRLERAAGQNEPRWAHLLGGPVSVAVESEAREVRRSQSAGESRSDPAERGESQADRLARLEETIERLFEDLRELERQLGGI
ncbi:MAG TPA: YceH family protein [Thermoanaerobaculia bacterium]|nr:YceH family protein [Thermoanaerobaculia bacterium]